MKKLRKSDRTFLLHLLLLIVLSVTGGVLLTLGKDSILFIFLILFTFIILLVAVFRLWHFLKRMEQDTSRLINGIRFSESNMTFRNFEGKGLPQELAIQMEHAINLFNKKLFQAETEQQFYNNLLNRIDAGILVIDKNGTIEWINKAALDEFGKPQPRKIEDLVMVSPELPVILQNIRPKETKILKIQKENTLHQLAATAVLFSAKGKEMKLISIKNIESVLEESESDAWKKLIRVLTHEMMNSITPIISLSESFSGQHADQANSELMGRAMDTIHRRSKGLVDFVQNYQKLTRIPNPVSDPVAAKDIMDDITGLLAADHIRFSWCITPDDMIWNVDRGQMEQVLINLIKNAWEACAEQSNPEININIYKNEYQQPVVVIDDNGYGILPEVMEKIFVPFFTTKPKGSGIGLSICRQIIGAHGGTITVTSEPGKGSCFTIRL